MVPSSPDAQEAGHVRHFESFIHSSIVVAATRPAPQERQQNVASDGASPWMWATLVALLVVVPSWWWARHSDESFAPDTRPLPVESRQILPTTDGPRAMTMVAHQPARPAISSVEAKPLPGNAMPSYPAAVARAGIQGSRTARLQLDVQGRVSDVTIVERSRVTTRGWMQR